MSEKTERMKRSIEASHHKEIARLNARIEELERENDATDSR